MTTAEIPVTAEAERASLAGFLQQLGPMMRRLYDRGVNRDLSRQQWSLLLQRNVREVMAQIHSDALNEWRRVEGRLASGSETSAASDQAALESLRESLAKMLLSAVDGLVDELVSYAVEKHRNSCAISNFPDEHRPSQDYVAETLALIRQAQIDFAHTVQG